MAEQRPISRLLMLLFLCGALALGYAAYTVGWSLLHYLIPGGPLGGSKL